VTGSDMLRPPLPENRFFLSVLRMNDTTLSWAYFSFLFTSM